jgi:hypothetical protein
MILRNKNRLDWLLAICLTLLVATSVRAAVPVGEVSLVIGSARIVGDTGSSATVMRGLPVFPGDRIETEDGGHVHLRFVDGAFVSVRPGSRLQIETYQYDPAQPKESAIRFRLEQGVARSITGKGGEAARDHFRLNTPIAAIGVKGTDFVVQATGDDVRVAVHSGAIVMAPIGDGCASDAFGPCNTDAARTLSADMGRVMLEFNRQQGAPRVVPLNGQLPSERLGPPAGEDSRLSSLRRNEASTETQGVRTVDAGRDLTPPPTPPKATLVWGHWPWSTALPGDNLSVPYAEGRQNGERVSVGGNDYYVLFRDASQSSGILPTNLGRASFTLRDSQVNFIASNGETSVGSSRNGWFKVDFGSREFETGMTLSHGPSGNTQMSASGSIDRRGKFISNTADTQVSGALTIDGQEAGYSFIRDVTSGRYIGITRWYR